MPSSVDQSESVARRLNVEMRALPPVDRLRRLREAVPGRIVFTTSFGLEDQALTEVIAEAGVDVELATLDTGRLFPQTYGVWTETEARYGLRIRALYPDRDAIEALVADQGIDGFYFSVEMRKACCGVRKVEPLRRALAGADAWITGLRADQSAERHELPFAAFDAAHGLLKVNPLLDWSREAIAAFAKDRGVPINPLHEVGFLSIGCAPCTRAVRPGENERAGRWWWEQENSKECGLHVDASGALVRAKTAPEPAGEPA